MKLLWCKFRNRTLTECYENIRSTQSIEDFQKEISGDEAHRIIESKFKTPGLVLDIGCGGGRYCYFLRQMGHTVIGMDLAYKSLHRFADHRNKIYFLGGSGCALPIASESIDYILIVGIVYEILDAENRRQLFSEIARVLKKPNGICCYVDNMYPNLNIRFRSFMSHVQNRVNQTFGIGPKMMIQSLIFNHKDIQEQFEQADMLLRTRRHCNVAYGVAHWSRIFRKKGMAVGTYKFYAHGGTTLNFAGRMVSHTLQWLFPALGAKSCCYLAEIQNKKLE